MRASPMTSAAERALALVMADPRRARTAAETALSRALDGRDAREQVLAERALGLAARELQDAQRAERHLRRAVRLAERAVLPSDAAEARMSLALVLDDQGRPAAALKEIDRAVADLRGLPQARARMQRAIILRRIGRESEALHAYGAALASFQRARDRLWQARVLTNRGVLHAYRGTLRHAEKDLRTAERLYSELNLPAAVAQVRHNLGFVAAQAGAVPAALTWYDLADEHFRRNGRPAVALLDRAELLLAARLLPEARQAALAAVESASAAGLGSVLAQAQLLVAQSALAAGDHQEALTPARAARRALRRQGRHRWATLAEYAEWRASTDGAPATPGRLVGARRIAASLHEAGWAVESLEARLRAATLASTVDSQIRGDVMAELAEAAAELTHGPARLRVRAWHARALGRLHAGDRRGASRALLHGLRLLDEYRAALGATELRIHSSAEGNELAALGLRLALDEKRPRQVLAWAERWRATALRLPPPPPDYGDELARDLARLRRVTSELAATDEPHRIRQLTTRQRGLEDAVRRATWRSVGTHGVHAATGSVAEICAALGDWALVELVDVDGALLALVAAGGRVRQVALGPVETVQNEAVALRFALRRLALRHGSAASLAVAATAASHGAARLDSLLLSGVRAIAGDRPLVIVPTGALHTLPWPMLPSCRGRPVVVAPSATAWWRASAGEPSTVDGRLVLVAADTPQHAPKEVATLADELPRAVTLTGGRARVRDVLARLDGASGAHLAAHGEFRADNPLFSHVRLADGPLTVYDLLRLRRPPRLMVLSACDTGLSAVHPGDELMGLASALLGLGTRTLVASVGPVNDEETRVLMVDLHRRLRAGAAPAEALAGAQAAMPADAVSMGNFVCLGAG